MRARCPRPQLKPLSKTARHCTRARAGVLGQNLKKTRASGPLKTHVTDIHTKILRPSWTPGSRDFNELFEMLERQEMDKDVVRALLRAANAGALALIARIETAESPNRGRLTRALQKFGTSGDLSAREHLISMINDADEHARRMAISAVGQWKDLDPEVALKLESDLLAVVDDVDDATRRTIQKTLGRIGAEKTRDWLTTKENTSMADVLIERRLTRTGEQRLDLEAMLESPVDIQITCKPGLEGIVEAQLAGAFECKPGPGRLTAKFSGPLLLPYASRSMMSYRFVFSLKATGNDVDDVVKALSVGKVSNLLKTISPDGARFRLNWVSGKRRSDTREVAKRIAADVPWLVNDPVERDWEFGVEFRNGRLFVTCEPRLDDPRFTWRVADVPAASHPTVAAALVWLSEPRKDDVVWDPFMGSGLELAERAHIGPFERLIGSDIDQDAIDAANLNFANVEAEIEVHQADAKSFSPRGVTAIITNPPLGWRVHELSDLKDLNYAFLRNAWRVLKPGGRIAWTTRFIRDTDPEARRLGFKIRQSFQVDLGGLNAHMQLLEKP